MPLTHSSHTKEQTNSGQFSNMSKGFSIINAFDLAVALRNQPGFVALDGPIGFKFDLVHPFAPYRAFVRWVRNKGPSMIGLKSVDFMFHGSTPLWILDSLQESGRLLDNGDVSDKGFMGGR